MGIGLLAAILVVIGLLWTHLENRFIFFPTGELVSDPGQFGLPYEDVTFTTERGYRLHGWFIPGNAGGSGGTWLWMHGNGGNISHRAQELAMIHHRLGVNVFIFDYQGYGRSEGKPTEQGTYRDARSALEYLSTRPDVDRDRIVYFGRSLGSAVAVNLAADRLPLGLVLVSPISSIEDMAKMLYPFLPSRWLARGRFDSENLIGKVASPLLVIHGARDDIVPPVQGEKVFAAAREPKRLVILPNAGHNDTPTAGGEEYWNALEVFMAELAAGNCSDLGGKEQAAAGR